MKYLLNKLIRKLSVQGRKPTWVPNITLSKFFDVKLNFIFRIVKEICFIFYMKKKNQKTSNNNNQKKNIGQTFARLKSDREIPANKAMEGFFVPQGDKYRGGPITTLPVVLNNDLSRLECSNYCLKTFKDIENLKKIAEQRDQWRILCTRIQKAAEALQSDDYDAELR